MSTPGAEEVGWLGSLEQLRGAVLVNRLDLIVCAAAARPCEGPGPVRAWERVASTCLDLGVRMIGANQFYEELLGHVPIGTIDAAWYRYIMHPRFRSAAPLRSACLDLTVGAGSGSCSRRRSSCSPPWP